MKTMTPRIPEINLTVAVAALLADLRDNGFVNLQTGAVESRCDPKILAYLYESLGVSCATV